MSPLNQSPADFDRTVTLHSIQNADRTLARFIPVLLLLAAGVLVLSLLILGLVFPRLPGLYYPLSVLIAVVVPTLMYLQKRKQLAVEYEQRKRLILSPVGLCRVDSATVVEIPWSGIDRLQPESVSFAARSKGPIILPVTAIANAAKDAAHSVKELGILGAGTVRPAVGASDRVLRMHDERNGSRLQAGELRHTPNALIFPAEFERDWVDGTIGGWVRHYRPDIPLERYRL
ncbi:hypothetical protein [Mycolicibacterium sp.]|uniref:hypothetical protein n=1 Tax=Mycolicibacterium sp. TaxID=2320850 RepID=UPI0037C7597C